MTVRLPFCRFLAIFIFFIFSPISLVFINRFSKFFQLKISKLNFPSFEKNNNDRQSHSRNFVLRYLWMLSSLFYLQLVRIAQGLCTKFQNLPPYFVHFTHRLQINGTVYYPSPYVKSMYALINAYMQY